MKPPHPVLIQFVLTGGGIALLLTGDFDASITMLTGAMVISALREAK